MRIFALLLLSLGLAFGAPAAAAPFLAESVDIPLMPGLAERQEARLLFDAPEGRIFETVLEGEVGLETAVDYYRRSLIALGWEAQKPKPNTPLTIFAFAREKEQLILVFDPGPARLVLHISLTPK